jgi:hypothetical protein
VQKDFFRTQVFGGGNLWDGRGWTGLCGYRLYGVRASEVGSTLRWLEGCWKELGGGWREIGRPLTKSVLDQNVLGPRFSGTGFLEQVGRVAGGMGWAWVGNGGCGESGVR